MTATLWDRCLSRLEIELSEQQLNTWIRPLQARQESPALWWIMAPNRFVLDMVQSSFHSRIQEIATALTAPDPVQLKLIIGTGEDVDTSALTQTSNPAAANFDGQSNAAGTPGKPDGGKRSAHTSGVSGSGTPGSGMQFAPARSQIAANNSTQAHQSGLNPMFTFATLVAGKSNQLGRAAALQISQNPGSAYNPFLIYGASGLGKTHLMHAIGHGILEHRPNARVAFLNSERYVHDMVAGLQHGRMNEFKKHFRSLDALLIDDVQFFANKDQTQEEFFHNFNALFEGGQQIVLTCDRYPNEVNGLEYRLKTRFGWGLSVAVEPPELEMRVAILNSKAEQNGVVLPSEVSFFIAKRIRSNVRELEGALSRVLANAQLMHTPITIDLARHALQDQMASQDKLVTIDNIQKTVAEYYNIRLADLSSKGRSRSIARPRQLAMALSKELTSKSLPEIGRAFGGRDHTTVLHACKKITELRESDERIREDHVNLLRTLSS